MTEPENELLTASNALRRAIQEYNAAYQATIARFPNYSGPAVGRYSGPSLDVATQRYERCARKFNALAEADMDRSGHVSSLVVATRDHQRDNGFWTREIDAIIDDQKAEKVQ